MSEIKVKQVFVAGHNGMVGQALCRRLASDNEANVLTRERSQLDLTNHIEVAEFFNSNSIDEVYLAAAKVGGIHANNTYPADFIEQNLAIELNVIRAAYQGQVGRLLFLGSSCIYPRDTAQPIKESQLLTGPLEPTNEQYAIAKIAGIKLCEAYNRQHGTDFRSAMPTNLYGPGDNFHLQDSHVVPALLRRLYEARLNGDQAVTIWGTGTPRREFLHVNDLADACIHLMRTPLDKFQSVTEPHCSHINVGTGVDCTIRELATIIASITGFKGELVFDASKPDGTPRKLLELTRLHQLGWEHKFTLQEGLEDAFAWFQDHIASKDFRG